MRWLNYHHLYYFWTVARLGTIAAASRELFLSPPAISTQLKQLELAVGQTLFVRSGRVLRLTDAGRTAYAYAEQIFRLGEALLEELDSNAPVSEMVAGRSGTHTGAGDVEVGGSKGRVRAALGLDAAATRAGSRTEAMMKLPEIIISTADFERLERLLEQYALPEEVADFLERELSRAERVPASELPPDVVTMNSRLRFEDLDTGAQREVRLVFPEARRSQESAVSVLAPVGVALIGLRAGQAISYRMPRGGQRSLRVLEVLDS